MNIESIYSSLPVFLQNIVINAEGARLLLRRYGADYKNIEEKVAKRCLYSADQLHEYRSKCLNEHLIQAYQTPFWRSRFDEYDVKLNGNNPFEQIQKLPILTKEEVKKNIFDIINPTIDSANLISAHTSGTTGSGMIFKVTREMEKITFATWWRFRRRHGIKKNDICAYFGGRSIVPIRQCKPPYWRFNMPNRQLMLSGYHLSESTACYYAKAICDANVKWMHGYPSLISLFADYVINQSLVVPPLTVVTTGSENLLASQKKKIEKAFNTKVVELYGQSEGVAIISECASRQLHVDEDYSCVEFISIEGSKNEYKIVGTNWHNKAFPLFRYDTGDVVTIDDKVKCTCSLSGRIVCSIDGREEDYIVLENGVKVGRLDHPFKDMVNVREAQIIQKKDYTVLVRIVKGENYADRDEKGLIKELRKRIGKDVIINLEYVEKIWRTKTGKLRFVVKE